MHEHNAKEGHTMASLVGKCILVKSANPHSTENPQNTS